LAFFILAASNFTLAHRTSPTRSLRSLVSGADLVVHVWVLGPDQIVVQKDGNTKRRPVVRAKVLEVVKGPKTVGPTLTFAQHGHGVAEYRKDDEAILFLKSIGRSAELASLGAGTSLRWYSEQEEDDDYKLSARSRGPTLAAARAYAAIEPLPSAERSAALRRITVKLLGSRDRRIAVSALRDLRQSARAIQIQPDDVPDLERIIENPKAPIEVRVGVLAELVRRELLDGDARWAKLLETSADRERLVVIRAVATYPGPEVDAALMAILAGADQAARSEAAISLGHPGNDAAVAPLSQALSSTDPRLAMAAARGLGGIGNDEARAALRTASESHPDEAVRRKARAELVRLDRQDTH
jgi:hypothetical protein